MILVVAYDLHQPGRDYPKVEKLLKTGDGGWAHPQGSVWFLDTSNSPAWWRDQLNGVGDASDEFFVGQLTKNWAGSNMDKPVGDWLKARARRW
jgi:hypothetical protein